MEGPPSSRTETVGSLLAELEAMAPEVFVVVTDPGGFVVERGSPTTQRLGASDGSEPPRHISAFLTVSDARAITLLLAEPGTFRRGPLLLNFVHPSGEPFTVRTVLQKGPEGLVLAGVRTLDDDSRLGDELVRLNNDLAAATRESARKGRELERTLSELRQAQALLVHKEKMASLGQTTAGVAHEINNPLAFVISINDTLTLDFKDVFGFVNAVGDQLDAVRQGAPSAARAIDAAAKAAELGILAESVPRKLATSAEGLERIRQIVADLRVFSRLDEAEHKDVDLVESLAATLRFLEPLRRDRGVTIETSFPPAFRLFCSPGALNQAVSNLVANALQASRPGGSVRVSLLPEDSRVVIRVADDGYGIPKENVSRVFDPFFTTKPVGEGVGLGLAIAHQVVASHGGTIAIESEPGRGTTMDIVLPLSGKRLA